MRRAIYLVLGWAMLLAAARAEIIDRVAVSIGNRVITESDLDREIRITAFENNDQPDFSAANKRATAERLVDQTLVRGELEASRYLLPAPADTGAALEELRRRFPDAVAYHRALAAYGITEDDLKARLLWQLTLVRFVDVRFRPGIQISDDEIRDYFNEHFRGTSLSLEEARDKIEHILVSQAADKQVDQWLDEVRKRARIVYHEEAFE
jgi:peptidyl-prolyl cis-trans isomerase SurA